MVHFEAENNSFPAASKLARRAGPETARAPTATHDGIRAQALVQHHTGNFFFSLVSHMWDTPRKWVKQT